MLFDSTIFIFCFLPVTLLGFFLLTYFKKSYLRLSWLVVASLFFYGWWNPPYLILLLSSIIVNYGLGRILWRRASENKDNNLLLWTGLGLNLLFIGYFKYAYFVISNINGWFAATIPFDPVLLPLGISFFTFQKIAFLVDASRGEIKAYRFLDYCLFVTFFPQLIAGPIVQHKQLIPQLENPQQIKVTFATLSIGLTLFFMGLIKKIGLADNIAPYANAVFEGAAHGITLSFWEAWCGAIAYTLQLYFDFSGYSDMALGLAYMFGIKLPINFYSPYQATNIIDFWRRWHMTLSAFLRNYLYIPLGGNRNGNTQRHINLMITMLLGGLWHGANWTFVLWGALHGLYLTINHGWRQLCLNHRALAVFQSKSFQKPAQLLTLLAVITAWVPFRSDSLQVSQSILRAMYSFENFSLPSSLLAKFPLLQQGMLWLGSQSKGMFMNGLADWQAGLPWLLGLLAIALFSPNTGQMMHAHLALEGMPNGGKQSKLQWHPTILWAGITCLLILFSIMLLSEESEFLYFQF